MNIWRCLVTVFFAAALVAFHPQEGFAFSEGAEHRVGQCVNILDFSGKKVSKIAGRVVVGDEVITCDGDRYRVVRVIGNRAAAHFLGQDKEYITWCSYFNSAAVPVSVSDWQHRPVGIYHTHSDESYLPSDGRASIPFHGGIYQVGSEFSSAVKRYGVRINYDRTPHDPHDAMAYVRSRRTAIKLMKNAPAALFDVHRDGIPDANYYREEIAGKEISRLRLVIGRGNPKKAANLDFAKRLMAYANKKHPKVVKEIFIGSGNYNQDLMSTALLIEAGTYTNHKGNAEDGIALLAGAVPVVLGLTGQDRQENRDKSITGEESQSTHLWVLIVLLLVVIIGSGVFVSLNMDHNEVLDKIKNRTAKFYRRLKR